MINSISNMLFLFSHFILLNFGLYYLNVLFLQFLNIVFVYISVGNNFIQLSSNSYMKIATQIVNFVAIFVQLLQYNIQLIKVYSVLNFI